MSALFEKQPGIIVQPIQLSRTLELRDIPHVRQVSANYPAVENESGRSMGQRDPEGSDHLDTYVVSTLKDQFSDLATSWMYSAIIEASLNGTETSWSKDDWNFVPLNVSSTANGESELTSYQSNAERIVRLDSPVNVTVQTPALRARVKCTPSDEIIAQVEWLIQLNMTRFHGFGRNITSGYSLAKFLDTSEYSTTMIPTRTRNLCCSNQTDSLQDRNYTAPIAIGYWTTNKKWISEDKSNWTGNFTAKWVWGMAGFSEEILRGTFFTQPPQQQFLNCMPIIESSDAEVTVEESSGRVISYKILKDSKTADVAWSDTFVIRNISDRAKAKSLDEEAASDTSGVISVDQNVTTRYVLPPYELFVLRLTNPPAMVLFSSTHFLLLRPSVLSHGLITCSTSATTIRALI